MLQDTGHHIVRDACHCILQGHFHREIDLVIQDNKREERLTDTRESIVNSLEPNLIQAQEELKALKGKLEKLQTESAKNSEALEGYKINERKSEALRKEMDKNLAAREKKRDEERDRSLAEVERQNLAIQGLLTRLEESDGKTKRLIAANEQTQKTLKELQDIKEINRMLSEKLDEVQKGIGILGANDKAIWEELQKKKYK